MECYQISRKVVYAIPNAGQRKTSDGKFSRSEKRMREEINRRVCREGRVLYARCIAALTEDEGQSNEDHSRVTALRRHSNKLAAGLELGWCYFPYQPISRLGKPRSNKNSNLCSSVVHSAEEETELSLASGKQMFQRREREKNTNWDNHSTQHYFKYKNDQSCNR